MPSVSDDVIPISIVLPVHQVQEYLSECLDSIFQQSFTDFEVIAVDDASPDDCGRILDDYARREPRLRVVHLGRNVGLGQARNTGLSQARGDYVWFVDSDDWMADGALQSIVDRLARSQPDVLLFDHARVFATDQVVPNPWSQLLREPPPPEVFTLPERPAVMGLMMTAWNKAIRREFLVGLGPRFGRGFYEDVAVTYPLLMAAEKICLLDQVCYFYRERRAGAITMTPSDRHFEVFPEYEKIFAFMDRLGRAADPYRSTMFDRAMWHYTTIIEEQSRVPAVSRRRFFHKMSEHFRRYKPTPYSYPQGARGTKFRLVERDAYRLFRALRPVNRIRLTLRTATRRLRRAARTTARRAKAVVPLAYYQIQRRLPMDSDLAVYAAYWYRGYACNPKAIYEKARNVAPQVHGVWVVRPDAIGSLPAGVDYVVPGSRRYLRVMARAKYLVNNVNFPHGMSKRRGAIHLQTLHGTPLKAMGLDQARYPAGGQGMNLARLRQHSARWDFTVSANPLTSQVWRRVYPGDYEVLEVGYPRNDRFFHTGPQEIEEIRAGLGVTAGQTVILYAPTHRDHSDDQAYPVDLAGLAAALGPDYVLLARAHYFYRSNLNLPQPTGAAQVIDVSAHPVVEDLCLAADLLVTDYSSIMFDYAHLDRPIVIYAPDWESYRRTRGVTFDLLAEPPGAVARTEDELIECFRAGVFNASEANAARAAFRERFCVFDDGQSAERVVRRVFLGGAS